MSRPGKQQDLVLYSALHRVRASDFRKDSLHQRSACPGAEGTQNYGDIMNQGEWTSKSKPP